MLGVNFRSSSSSSCPSPPHISSISNVENLFNVSPRLSSHLYPIVQLDRSLPHRNSPCLDSKEDTGCRSIVPVPYNSTATPKSSAELRTEIATLETEILHMERYLLSLYRTAFEEHLPTTFSKSTGTCLEYDTGSLTPIVSHESYDNKLKPDIKKGGFFNPDLASPAHDLSISDDRISAASLIKAASKREQKKSSSGHRSLADHLGASREDIKFDTADRVSEDIVRCISSIYCKLANAPNCNAGLSASPTSSLSSSSIFSSKHPCDSWSPHCYENTIVNHQGLKEERGPQTAMVEVLKIYLDDDTFKYAAVMLQNFRSLVRNLEKVDPRKMKREEKLAFWINIHNALVMHAYLAYGTRNRLKSSSILKAAYNVGGHFVDAYVIQTSILGIRPHHSSPWLQTLFSPGRKSKTGSMKHVYALEYPEPLVHFALCSGVHSDPVVRVYTARTIFQDLKLAKEEFIQASTYIHKESKIFLPKIVYYFAKDMSLDVSALLELISGCLSEVQKKAIRKCVKGRHEKCINWLPQSSTFRLIQIAPFLSKETHLRNESFQLWIHSKLIIIQITERKKTTLVISSSMIHFVLLVSRQGKVRLAKWYSAYSQKERAKLIRELSGVILTRAPKLCNFVEWMGLKVVYKRYAGLYFCMCIDQDDNELEILDIIHHYVEILDRYFGSVCELDLIFNFHKAYYILDEILIAGELQESSKRVVGRLIDAQDSLVEIAKEQASLVSSIIAQATK
ncbi:hypothetical protein LWI29_022570 [Acer saccharum]|uniref:Adaptor AP-1 19 kDa protein n=1 Tax=Acer saccharum TaxID=4024 RepID=A0AA39RQD2_ACESA|nr:hypothetical protein LWI29_022570 [Acer saccharum]